MLDFDGGRLKDGVGEGSRRYASLFASSPYSASPFDLRPAGSFGLELVHARKTTPALEITGLSDLSINACLTATAEIGLDVGDGMRVQRQVPAGTINVLPPGITARALIPSGRETLTGSFDGPALSALMSRHDVELASMDRYVGQAVRQADAVAIMQRMWNECVIADRSSDLFVDALSLQLLALLVREERLSPWGIGGVEDRRIGHVVQFIEAHLADDLSINGLAEIAALSPGYFARSFRKATGEAVWQYVMRRRCERARERIVRTGDALAQIAFDCGFAKPRAHEPHLQVRLRHDAGQPARNAVGRPRAGGRRGRSGSDPARFGSGHPRSETSLHPAG